jgi:hypothetical protein
MEEGEVISPLVAIEPGLGREENINPLPRKCAINHVIGFIIGRQVTGSYSEAGHKDQEVTLNPD